MTWSFAITNGDLSLSNNDFQVVTGEDKLIQDLTCYVLERMGLDPNTPGYGSLLTGGIDGEGVVYQSMLGLPNSVVTEALIQNELQRILLNYQNLQIQRAKNDLNRFGKTSFSRGEVLLSVNSFSMRVMEDVLLVTISITTGNNTSVDLSIPLPSTSV